MSRSFDEELSKARIIPTICKNKICKAYLKCPKIPSEKVGSGRVKYLFVGPFPDENDKLVRRPLSAVPGTTIRNIILRAKIAECRNFTYVLTSLCKYYDSSENRLNKEGRKEYTLPCLNILKREIKKHNPEIVVLFGMEAVEALFPNAKYSMDNIHGNYLESSGIKYYVTYNPTYFLKTPDKLGEIYYDLCYLFGRKKPKINITYGDASCDRTYKILTNYKQIQAPLKKMYHSKHPVILDIETTSLNRLKNTVLTFQLYNGGRYAYIIPWAHPETPFTHNGIEINRKLLNKFLDGKGDYPFVVGHNLKYDFTVSLNAAGVEIKACLMDTMACAFMLDETHTKDDGDDADQIGATGGYGLGSQLVKYGFRDDWYFNAKNNRANLANEPLEYVARYGGGDVVLNYELLRCQLEEAKIKNYPKFRNFLEKFYSEQVKLFSDIETNGVAINVGYLAKLMSTEDSPLLNYIEKVKQTLYKLPSVKKANKLLSKNQTSLFGSLWIFDIDKPDHARLLFFDVLKLKPLSFGKLQDGSQGAPSLDKNFITNYKSVKEVALLKKLRRAKQLYGLYPKAFHAKIAQDPDCFDGRIRANFKGMSTRSGRGSCANPNLQQNIREDGSSLVKIVRGLYTASPGKILVKLDIMANEIRCWGSIAKDPVLKKVVMRGYNLRQKYFEEGPDDELYKRVKLEGDLHRSNAAAFNTKNISDVTDDDRQASKNTTFGTIYGLSDFNLAKNLKKTVEETREIKKRFFTTLNKGKKWLDYIAKFSFDNLYCESPLGRRRRLWHFLVSYPLDPFSHSSFTKFNTSDKRVKHIHGMGIRRAMNTPIQALGSDIAFLGSYIVRWHIKRNNLYDWWLYNVVHDSLEAEIPVTDIYKYVLVAKLSYEKILHEYLKKAFGYSLYIPVEVDFEMGFEGNKMVKWDGALKSLKILQRKYIKLNSKRSLNVATFN